jgi:uncharacterized protein (TIGR02466 family)
MTRALFPTLLYEASLADARDFTAFNAELEEACLMLAEEDHAGQAWCRREGYGGYTSYASLNDLPLRARIFGELKKRLDRHAAKFAGELAFDLGGRRPRLDSLWVNVLKPGAAHSGHIHPHSIISGTVYVSVPKGASAIRFEDPRLPLMMAAPTPAPDAPEGLKRFVSLQPSLGAVVMWESWLRHEVPANRARAPRISISFNYA